MQCNHLLIFLRATDNSNICKKTSDVNSTVWVAQGMMKSIRSECTSPCNTMQVSAKGNNITPAKSGKPQLVLYFQSRIQIGKEHYLYTLISFFADVGGYVGFILGYSLLNIAEVIMAALDKKLGK